MNFLVEINDESKAAFFINLMKEFKYVKYQAVSPAKSKLLKELKEALVNVKRVEDGTMKAKTLTQLLNEV